MSGHLCLKWNNHSTAFIKSISNIQIKERYCDATIACQGKYFPVHRVVLSTCSDYFDEMFERIQNPHPYIVFKDIEPREMELLLNYMYQGEVNVVQENLPTLIKAAEALKVKGLAVPDDLPSNKESSGRKRGNTSNDAPVPKRRSEEKRRRRDSSDQTPHPSTSSSGHDREHSRLDHQIDHLETKLIKEEPLDTGYNDPPLSTDYGEPAYSGGDGGPDTNQANSTDKSEGVFVNFPLAEESEPYVKQEEESSVPTDSFNDEQASSWSDFASGDIMQELPETSGQDDVIVSIPEADPMQITLGYDLDLTSLDCGGIGSDNTDTSSFDYGSALTRTPIGYECPYCDYMSNKLHNAKRHIRCRHTGERPFSCEICLKRFTDNCELKIHKRCHTGERPFVCTVCDKRFSQSSHLSSHKKNVHKLM